MKKAHWSCGSWSGARAWAGACGQPSDPVKANRMGVNVPRARLSALIASGILAALSGVAYYATTTTGDANSGQELVFTSVTAVVIAGASIFGGSGSAIAVAVAAFFLATITNTFTFLSLSVAWQYWVQGLLVLITAAIPMAARSVGARRRTTMLHLVSSGG